MSHAKRMRIGRSAIIISAFDNMGMITVKMHSFYNAEPRNPLAKIFQNHD